METGFNLLPDEFRVRQVRLTSALLSAAAVFVLAVIVHLGFMLHANKALEGGLTATRNAQLAIMRETFPELTRVVNPLVQARQVVAKLQTSARPQTSMLHTLHTVGHVFPRGTSNAPTLAGINYADGILNLRLHAKDIASLNAYSEALKPFARAEVVSVDTQEEGVDGSLRVQPLAGGSL